jgi:hypothetical protein
LLCAVVLILISLGLGLVQRSETSTAQTQEEMPAGLIAQSATKIGSAGDSRADPTSTDTVALSDGKLQVGAYITNISDIDLLEDRFSIEMLV